MFNELSTCCVTTPYLVALECGMHESMERMYRAAMRIDPAYGRQTGLANAINESPQRVNNWETRGISKEGAIAAQHVLGISATYLLYGSEPAFVSQSQPPRMSGEMIRAAYREAVDFAAQGGAEAGDFDPGANPDDAGILALTINRFLAKLVGTRSMAAEGK